MPPVPDGTDDSVQTFGQEAKGQVLAAAAQAVRGFYENSGEGRWQDACYYLSPDIIEAVAQSVGGTDCPTILRKFSRGVPARVLERQSEIQVGSVRSDGRRGFVIYKDVSGDWHAVTVENEGGEWKLSVLAGIPLGY